MSCEKKKTSAFKTKNKLTNNGYENGVTVRSFSGQVDD
jgi:hypothetical protein